MTLSQAIESYPTRTMATGPSGLPIIGILPQIRKDPLRYLLRLSREYEDVVRLNFGFEKVFMVTNPTLVGHVLRDKYKNYPKSAFYNTLRPMIGNGMFVADGQAWRRQRQAAQPAFHKEALAKMTNEMVSAIRNMLDRWERDYSAGEPFNLSVEMTRLALDVLFRTLLSVPLGDQTGTVFDSLTTALQETERRVWSLTHFLEKLPTPANLAYRRAIKNLDEVVDRVIEARRADPAHHKDLLAMFMSACTDPETGALDKKMLRDEVMTSIIAGHETTVGTLTWATCLMSKNPAVERLVAAEALSAYSGEAPEFGDIKNLTYTKMVIDETLRLFPPGWTMSRTALEDDDLGGYFIPKGASIMVSPYIVHRNADHWPNPEGFEPERFEPDRAAKRHPHAYFPFGAGPRACVGQQFALMEAQLILTMVAARHRLELVPGASIEPVPRITMRPKSGALVTLRRQPGR